MYKLFDYAGITFEVKYTWDDDARTNMEIVAVCVEGSTTDIWDVLSDEVRDALFEKLEESFCS